MLQHEKVRKIRQMRQADHRHIQLSLCLPARQTPSQRILILDVDVQIGCDTDHWNVAKLF